MGACDPSSRRRLERSAIVVLAACFVSCCAVEQEAGDLPYRSGTILRHENGTLRRGKLLEATEFQGLPCRSWLWWHDDGKLESAELARNFTYQGHDFPEGARLFLDREARLVHAWLGSDRVVDGRLCRGGGKIDVSFHPNGNVKEFFPPEDVVIEGVPCEASPFHPVALHPDGRLRRCKLASDWSVDGRTFEKGSLLELDERGRPSS